MRSQVQDLKAENYRLFHFYEAYHGKLQEVRELKKYYMLQKE